MVRVRSCSNFVYIAKPYVYVFLRTVVWVGTCFIYAMEIVLSQDERVIDRASWAAEAEPVTRGGRRASRCSSPACGRFGIYVLFEKSFHVASNHHRISK